ncbi:hypothetical protein [Aestuariivirga sp.]|uniref:hypothetical protein n=1 Tax=Aestuariivirga sp. TaxID=2650926 RepID=UPI003018EBB7
MSELDPEGRSLRHETRPGAKANEHHRNRNALLPVHAQAAFLLGMAQTSTGVTRPMMTQLGTRQSVDVREFNETGFRIYVDRVGDEQSSIARANGTVLERLQNAWSLAFQECPGKKSDF